MKLVDMTVKDYLDLLKSDAPAPGGGSVSALSAAQGVGLVAMVADLTIGREKYAEYEEVCKAAKEEALKLYSAFIEGIDKDTEAFNKVSAAYKLPKNTDEEKAARSAAIREANVGATEVPFETVKLCLDGLKITETMVGKSNPNAASDLGVAALTLLSGIRGAWLNVKINLPGIKNEALKSKFETGEAMVDEAYVISKRIYEEVLASL